MIETEEKNFNFINFIYLGMSIEDEEPQLKGKGYPSLAIKAREIELVIDVGEREPWVHRLKQLREFLV